MLVAWVNVIVIVWSVPGQKGASHICRASHVRLMPSKRFDTTRGSSVYPKQFDTISDKFLSRFLSNRAGRLGRLDQREA